MSAADLKFPLRQVAWIGDALLSSDIRGVVVEFHGMNHTEWKTEVKDSERQLAADGLLSVFPYSGPWSWMNRRTRRLTDLILDAIWREFDLPDNVPLIIRGGSMGGCAALLYTRYTSRRVVACHALYPVCDLHALLRLRPELACTFQYAFADYDEPLHQILDEQSPLAQIQALPDIPYQIVQGNRDREVDKATQADAMVPAMRAAGLDVEYLEIDGFGHEAPTPQIETLLVDFVRRHASPLRPAHTAVTPPPAQPF